MRVSCIVVATWLLLLTFLMAFKGVISDQYEVQFTGKQVLDEESSRFIAIGRYVASARIPSRVREKYGSPYTVKFGKGGYFQVFSEREIYPRRLQFKVEMEGKREIEGWELKQLTESALLAMDREMENDNNYGKRTQEFLRNLKQSKEARDTKQKKFASDSKTEEIAKNQEMGRNSIANIQQSAEQIWNAIREERAKFIGNSGEELLKRDRKGYVVPAEPLDATGEVVSKSGKSVADPASRLPFTFPEEGVSIPLCVTDPFVLVEERDPAERSCHLENYAYPSGSVYDKKNEIRVSYILSE